MKLASKIFLGSALVMVVLVGVGILSLRAVGHLAAVNRDITMRALPTLGRAGAAHDAVLALVRLETRFLVLGDARYAALWDERAARVREDLAALRRPVRTAREQANGLTGRSRVLSEATAAGAAGSFREPIPERGADEIAALAHSFNAMAANLRQLDQLKESFLATVSHELRSPLTSMREAAHLLHEEVAGAPNPQTTPARALLPAPP